MQTRCSRCASWWRLASPGALSTCCDRQRVSPGVPLAERPSAIGTHLGPLPCRAVKYLSVCLFLIRVCLVQTSLQQLAQLTALPRRRQLHQLHKAQMVSASP